MNRDEEIRERAEAVAIARYRKTAAKAKRELAEVERLLARGRQSRRETR